MEEERVVAKEVYLFRHGPRARREQAEKRANTRALRRPEEQQKQLDLRLGTGVGAKKERARLGAAIAATKIK